MAKTPKTRSLHFPQPPASDTSTVQKPPTRLTCASDPMRAAFVAVMEQLRPGEVVSYGDVAERAGYPRRHRAVGQLLSASVDALPWWRVVYNSGHLPPCNPSLQEARLMEEQVTLKNYRVIQSPHGRFAKASSETIDANRGS